LRYPTFWPFVVVQIIVALYAWAAARAGLFRSFRTAVPAGLGLGVIASVTSTPISYLVFGCTTTGGIALTTALGKALGLPPLGACFFGSFVSDFGDKAVTFALVTSVLHGLPRRTAARFPWALRAIGAACHGCILSPCSPSREPFPRSPGSCPPRWGGPRRRPLRWGSR